MADSSATNEIQYLSISTGKGRIALSNGGSVLLNDSSATNELQKITRNGGRVFLDQNGGIISLPDSSSTNELQTLSQSGNVITLSNGGGSATFTDNDKQQIAINSTKGTISLTNGGNIKLADSSATNEIQELILVNDSLKLTKSNKAINIQFSSIKYNGPTVKQSTVNYNSGTSYIIDTLGADNELWALTIVHNTNTSGSGGGTNRTFVVDILDGSKTGNVALPNNSYYSYSSGVSYNGTPWNGITSNGSFGCNYYTFGTSLFFQNSEIKWNLKKGSIVKIRMQANAIGTASPSSWTLSILHK